MWVNERYPDQSTSREMLENKISMPSVSSFAPRNPKTPQENPASQITSPPQMNESLGLFFILCAADAGQ